MAQQLQQQIILFRTQECQQAYIAGVSGKILRWCPLSAPLDEEELAMYFRNFCELYGDGELTEEMLRKAVGYIVGRIIASRQ